MHTCVTRGDPERFAVKCVVVPAGRRPGPGKRVQHLRTCSSAYGDKYPHWLVKMRTSGGAERAAFALAKEGR